MTVERNTPTSSTELNPFAPPEHLSNLVTDRRERQLLLRTGRYIFVASIAAGVMGLHLLVRLIALSMNYEDMQFRTIAWRAFWEVVNMVFYGSTCYYLWLYSRAIKDYARVPEHVPDLLAIQNMTWFIIALAATVMTFCMLMYPILVLIIR